MIPNGSGLRFPLGADLQTVKDYHYNKPQSEVKVKKPFDLNNLEKIVKEMDEKWKQARQALK